PGRLRAGGKATPPTVRACSQTFPGAASQESLGTDGDHEDHEHEGQRRLVRAQPVSPDHLLDDAQHQPADDDTEEVAEAAEDGGGESSEHDAEAQVLVDAAERADEDA